jgi:hypothetical protein
VPGRRSQRVYLPMSEPRPDPAPPQLPPPLPAPVVSVNERVRAFLDALADRGIADEDNPLDDGRLR